MSTQQHYIDHTLAANEDLFFLAEYYYGSASAWPIIYHANIKQIGDDPERVSVGVKLHIPLLETRRMRTAMSTFISTTALTPSQDPLIQLAEVVFGDRTVYFEILGENSLEGTELIPINKELMLPARGNPYNLKRASFYREKFYTRGR